MLAGVNHIRYAFVTRRNAKDNTNHVVLGTYTTSVQEFAN